MRLCRDIIFINFVILILSSYSVSAVTTITDEDGDVGHWKLNQGKWGWVTNIERSDIDIKELSLISNGVHITLTMKVKGTIQSTENHAYYAWANTSDASYWLAWINGESIGFAMTLPDEAAIDIASMKFDYDPEITVEAGIITCIFDAVGKNFTTTEIWGYAQEYIDIGDVTGEWWGDWIPGRYAPFWGQNLDDAIDHDGDGNGGNGEDKPKSPSTPGFEMLTVISSIAIGLMVIIKKKK